MAHVTVWISPTSHNQCCYTTSWKSKHQKCNITAGYKCVIASSNGPQPCIYLFGIMWQCIYKTKICDINDLRKCLTQTWFAFKQDVIDPATDKWCDAAAITCACCWQTLLTCSKMNHVHLNDSSEHFMKLSIRFDAFNASFVVNIKRWMCWYAFSVSNFTT